jgi:hypothetical protein
VPTDCVHVSVINCSTACPDLCKVDNDRAAGGRLPGHDHERGFAVTAPAPVTVYDNTTNDNRSTVATGPDRDCATGNQVTLSGSARVVTDFLFGYVVDNDATVTVKFWANDGSKGAPGTCLFSSGPFEVPAGNPMVKTLSSLSVEVPDTFTWTVHSPTVGLIGYGPATVGSCGPAWYSGPVRNENEQIIGIWWYKNDPYKGGLEARISARKPLPHPIWSEEIVGQVLEGVINDAGGLVLVGGHIVRVPPREPVEAILAALPTQLAQRLKPLLQTPPQGDLPQLALRQRLSHAIAQYQAQSHG